MTNLHAERARYLAKREAERLRGQARRLLAGRWNATPAELRRAVADCYPELSPGEAAALVKVARVVQREDAPVHLPVETTKVRPLEDGAEPKVAWGGETERRKWERIFGASMARRPVVRRERGS